MAKYSEQTAFNNAYLGVMNQGRASKKSGPISDCVYRGPNNRACGVGHLITDKEYKPCMDKAEDTTIASVIDLFPKRIRDLDIQFLEDLQSAHDDANNSDTKTFRADFDHRMRRVATKYNLTVPKWKAK